MKTLIALAAALVLGSCAAPQQEGAALIGAGGLASTANSLNLADGTAGWLITCAGWANSMDTCARRAKLACPTGYRLANEARALTADRSMVVICATTAQR